MITRITGILNRVLDEEVRLQVGPFEYQVLVPEFVRRQMQTRTGPGGHAAHQRVPRRQPDAQPGRAAADRLPERGGAGVLRAVLHRGQGRRARRRSRRWAGPIKEIADAIQRQDAKWLTTLPGIGGRRAEQIVATLRRKVTQVRPDGAGAGGRLAERRRRRRRGRRRRRQRARGRLPGALLSRAATVPVRGARPARQGAGRRQDVQDRRGRAEDSIYKQVVIVRSGAKERIMAREAGRARPRRRRRADAQSATPPCGRSWLREVIGQKAVVQRPGIALNACKKLKEPLATSSSTARPASARPRSPPCCPTSWARRSR